MDEKVRIEKTVFKNNQFSEVVDKSFRTFKKPVENISTETVEEFFRLYEQLYYIIPVEGDTNSHEYLVKKSSELLDFEKNTEDIQPLLDEIAELRKQLLEIRQENINLQSKVAENVTSRV